QSPGPDSVAALEDVPAAAPNSDGTLVQRPGLHEYTLVEGGVTVIATHGDAKAPAGGAEEPVPVPEFGGEAAVTSGAYVNGDPGAMSDGYYAPAQDVAVQAAAEWYDALLRTYRLEEHPEWYGGAWLAGDELLAVAIVDGFRTPELEAEIKEAAGTGAVLQFSTVKYSIEFLYGLMEPATRALDGSGLACGIGVDVTANCLGVDLYSDEAAIPDRVLAALAHLDPEGDAIRVRVFTQSMNTLTDEVQKGPAPGGKTEPVFDGARVEDSEWTMPAEEPGEIEELPQAKYDIIEGE
ncbi:MAG: hypothetical protein K2M42_02035, partial [Oscillospiraceae bacterium]|nr:hypothetical protein [Oscillospiraceae bacterium]